MARIDIPDGEGGEAVQVWSLRPEMGGAVAKLSDAAYNKSILPVRAQERQAPACLPELRDVLHRVCGDEPEPPSPLEHAREPVAQAVHARGC